MGAFDDAVRRQEEVVDVDEMMREHHRKGLDALAPLVESLLLDFLQYVSERVQPVAHVYYAGLLLKKKSPKGYLLSSSTGGGSYSLYLLTPDARVFRALGKDGGKHSAVYYPLRDALKEGLSIGSERHLAVGLAHGNGYELRLNSSHGEYTTDVADALARVARTLVENGGYLTPKR